MQQGYGTNLHDGHEEKADRLQCSASQTWQASLLGNLKWRGVGQDPSTLTVQLLGNNQHAQTSKEVKPSSARQCGYIDRDQWSTANVGIGFFDHRKLRKG